MDYEGGEKIDLFTGMLHALIIDARRHENFREEHYHFTDAALMKFKEFQSIPAHAEFPGTRIEQAYAIWNQTPRGMLRAVLESVGVSVPDDYVQIGESTVFNSESDGLGLYVRYIPPAPFKHEASEP